MLKEISSFIAKYEIIEQFQYCLPFKNIGLLKKAQDLYVQKITEGQVRNANNERNAAKRKFDIGMAAQAAIAISFLALAILFKPLALVGLAGFALFGVGASCSLPARFSITGFDFHKAGN